MNMKENSIFLSNDSSIDMQLYWTFKVTLGSSDMHRGMFFSIKYLAYTFLINSRVKNGTEVNKSLQGA